MNRTQMPISAQQLIQQLQLIPHPEGGYYRETFRCNEIIHFNENRIRSAATAIYYLLSDNEISHLHRIKSDEIWFHLAGEPLEIVELSNSGKLTIHTIGVDQDLQILPQHIVKAYTWFGARVKDYSGFSLVSCVVAPGFDFADFEMADRNELQKLYPALSWELEQLCIRP